MGNVQHKNSDRRLPLNPCEWEGKWWLVGSTYNPPGCNRHKSIYKWDDCDEVFSISNHSVNASGDKTLSKATATIVGDRKLCLTYLNGGEETYEVLWTDYCNYAIMSSTNCEKCDDVWIASRHKQIPRCDLKKGYNLVRKYGHDPDYIFPEEGAIMDH